MIKCLLLLTSMLFWFGCSENYRPVRQLEDVVFIDSTMAIVVVHYSETNEGSINSNEEINHKLEIYGVNYRHKEPFGKYVDQAIPCDEQFFNTTYSGKTITFKCKGDFVEIDLLTKKIRRQGLDLFSEFLPGYDIFPWKGTSEYILQGSLNYIYKYNSMTYTEFVAQDTFNTNDVLFDVIFSTDSSIIGLFKKEVDVVGYYEKLDNSSEIRMGQLPKIPLISPESNYDLQQISYETGVSIRAIYSKEGVHHFRMGTSSDSVWVNDFYHPFPYNNMDHTVSKTINTNSVSFTHINGASFTYDFTDKLRN